MLERQAGAGVQLTVKPLDLGGFTAEPRRVQ